MSSYANVIDTSVGTRRRLQHETTIETYSAVGDAECENQGPCLTSLFGTVSTPQSSKGPHTRCMLELKVLEQHSGDLLLHLKKDDLVVYNWKDQYQCAGMATLGQEFDSDAPCDPVAAFARGLEVFETVAAAHPCGALYSTGITLETTVFSHDTLELWQCRYNISFEEKPRHSVSLVGVETVDLEEAPDTSQYPLPVEFSLKDHEHHHSLAVRFYPVIDSDTSPEELATSLAGDKWLSKISTCGYYITIARYLFDPPEGSGELSPLASGVDRRRSSTKSSMSTADTSDGGPGGRRTSRDNSRARRRQRRQAALQQEQMQYMRRSLKLGKEMQEEQQHLVGARSIVSRTVSPATKVNPIGTAISSNLTLVDPSLSRSLASLSDRLSEVPKTQAGSKFLQHQVRNGGQVARCFILDRVADQLPDIVTDMFGNYFVQTLFRECDLQQRLVILQSISSNIVQIACDRNGTYALQSIVELIDPEDDRLAEEIQMGLSKEVITVILDEHGTHVIQRFLRRFSSSLTTFITNCAYENMLRFATNPHAVAVLILSIDGASTEIQNGLVSDVLQHALALSRHPYGNYVVQHLLSKQYRNKHPSQFKLDPSAVGVNVDQQTHGNLTVAGLLVRLLQGNIINLACHKYSSNVVEKCAVFASRERSILIRELFFGNSLPSLLLDAYANYVIQTFLVSATPAEGKRLADLVRPHLHVFNSANTPAAVYVKWTLLLDRVSDPKSQAGGNTFDPSKFEPRGIPGNAHGNKNRDSTNQVQTNKAHRPRARGERVGTPPGLEGMLTGANQDEGQLYPWDSEPRNSRRDNTGGMRGRKGRGRSKRQPGVSFDSFRTMYAQPPVQFNIPGYPFYSVPQQMVYNPHFAHLGGQQYVLAPQGGLARGNPRDTSDVPAEPHSHSAGAHMANSYQHHGMQIPGQMSAGQSLHLLPASRPAPSHHGNSYPHQTPQPQYGGQHSFSTEAQQLPQDGLRHAAGYHQGSGSIALGSAVSHLSEGEFPTGFGASGPLSTQQQVHTIPSSLGALSGSLNSYRSSVTENPMSDLTSSYSTTGASSGWSLYNRQNTENSGHNGPSGGGGALTSSFTSQHHLPSSLFDSPGEEGNIARGSSALSGPSDSLWPSSILGFPSTGTTLPYK